VCKPALRAWIKGKGSVPRKPRPLVVGGTCHVYRRFGQVERCGRKVKGLAAVIGRDAGSASRLYAQTASARLANPAFAAIAEKVTHALRWGAQKPSERQ